MTEADGPLADLVLAFYVEVNAHDATAIAGLVDERFAADAVSARFDRLHPVRRGRGVERPPGPGT